MFSSPPEFQIPRNRIYRGEGNCNVVISLPGQRKILRVRKARKRKSLIARILEWLTDILLWYCGGPLDDESRDLKFYTKVLRPLLGNNFACEGQQVFLSRKQVRVLEREIEGQRPDFRKGKRLQYGRASLFDDYAFLGSEHSPFLLSSDTFAVEIKPKQGWVPFSEKQFPKCIFCMHQYLKLEKGQTKELSSYCPLQLFSGEATKMVTALKALVRSPQNNLKIFKNGKLCYGEQHRFDVFRDFLVDFFRDHENTPSEKLADEFFSLVQRCLTTDFQTSPTTNVCNRRLFCEWNKIIQENSVQSQLPKGCVLERILSVQMLDAEGHQYYCKLLGNRDLRDFDYVKSLLKEVDRNRNTCLKCTVMMLGNREDDLAFAPYLISAVAKDCSLMLTFRKVLEPLSDDVGVRNVVRTDLGCFVVNIGVFDLYPKPLSTIVKHRKKIKKIIELCSEEVSKSTNN